jgi:hypothetical protein
VVDKGGFPPLVSVRLQPGGGDDDPARGSLRVRALLPVRGPRACAGHHRDPSRHSHRFVGRRASGFRRNAGRNHLQGPGFATVDLSIVKTQQLSGRRSLQLRLEVFNLLNRANFDTPFNDPDGEALFDDTGARIPTAGKIFETSTDAREVQIALRFLF